MEIQSNVSGMGIRLVPVRCMTVPYPDYHYHIVREDGDRVGDIHLRLGSRSQLCYEGNIGYYIYPGHRGRGYAPAACRLLAKEAEKLGISSLMITIDPDNSPSRRVCQKLGAVLVEEVRIPRSHPLYRQGERRKCRYMWSETSWRRMSVNEE